jgi:hypothetical protein
MYNITPGDIEFAKIVKLDEEGLETRFNTTINKVEGTLNLMLSPLDLSHVHQLDKNKYIWNTACYVNIISLDLKILSKHQAFSESEWEKRFFSRQAALLIYESLDDILSFFGKEVNKISLDYTDDTLYNEDLKKLRILLNDFKDAHYKKLQTLRNTSIAHRDKNTLDQIKIIHSISWVESINLCSEFDRILNEIGKFLERLMRNGISDGDIKFDAY